jgi:hypothetical protein
VGGWPKVRLPSDTTYGEAESLRPPPARVRIAAGAQSR